VEGNLPSTVQHVQIHILCQQLMLLLLFNSQEAYHNQIPQNNDIRKPNLMQMEWGRTQAVSFLVVQRVHLRTKNYNQIQIIQPNHLQVKTLIHQGKTYWRLHLRNWLMLKINLHCAVEASKTRVKEDLQILKKLQPTLAKKILKNTNSNLQLNFHHQTKKTLLLNLKLLLLLQQKKINLRMGSLFMSLMTITKSTKISK
jgi:hypothetical protein